MRFYFLFLTLALFCTGCTNQARLEDYQRTLNRHRLDMPAGLTTQHCRGYDCRIVDTLTLTKKEWATITRPLKSKPRSAEQERENLRWVIGRFETAVGKMNGTSNDVPGSYWKLGNDQHDCTDESTNTTLYLLMLQNHNLLRYHKVGAVAGRFPPHLTAVIVETATGTPYAVDSWFHYNGVRAEVVKLDDWKSHWHPKAENLHLKDVKAPNFR